jgi:exosortase C (VPDSG-CTERM-specific)
MPKDVTRKMEKKASFASNPSSMRRLTIFGISVLALAVCFGRPLVRLIQFSLSNELYSYICFVPFIVLYLIWLRRERLRAKLRPGLRLTILFAMIGIAFLGLYQYWALLGWQLNENDSLCLAVLAFIFCFFSLSSWFLGIYNLRLLIFPFAFLFFLAPMPKVIETGLESFLQHASATVAYLLLKLVGTPVLRNDTQFLLPGVSIGVAPECSGIHSTLVLFLMALLAGHLFLERRVTKMSLVLGALALGICRNAVRIFILAQLSVNVSRDVLDSPLHHDGGPIFFAASLAPFFLFVWLLIKYDRWSVGSIANKKS